MKITKTTIDRAWRRREPGKRTIIRDKDCRGLALIVNATAMAWSYAYRPRGTDPLTGRRWPNKTLTIGNPATHSPEDARVEANRIKGQTAVGGDPAAERKARAEESRRKRGITLGRLADDYAAALPTRQKMRGAGRPSPGYVTEELSQLRLALAEIEVENTPAPDFGVADVRRLLDRAEGNNVRGRFGALSRFLDWCHDVGHIQANPCIFVARARRPRAPQPRAHFLTIAELSRLWHAADRLVEPVWRDFARFLIAVPCRRGEAAKLDWSHLDMAAGEWRQPGRLTKNRDPHRLYLHPLAVEVLKARLAAVAKRDAEAQQQRYEGIWPRSGLVFPAPVSSRVLDTFTAIKRSLIEATGPQAGDADDAEPPLSGWTWHDFRRSFATLLGEVGIAEPVADSVLNHRQAATRGGVLGVYQRASRWPEQVRAMELWGKLLANAITGTEVLVNVVPMVTRG